MPYKDPEKQREYRKERYKKNIDKELLYHKEYRRKNRDKLILKQRRRRDQRPELTREQSYKSNLKRRLIVLEKVSGINPKCFICGFSDLRALQVDHINNDGYLENNRNRPKGEKKNFLSILMNMSDEDVHKKYQILCANCNTIKEYERKQYEITQKNDQDKQAFKLYKEQIMDEVSLMNIQFMEVS